MSISKRIYFPTDVDDQLSRTVEARLTICNIEQTECYDWLAQHDNSGNDSYVR